MFDFGLFLSVLNGVDGLAKLAGTIKGGDVLQKHIEFLRDQLRAIGEAQTESDKENRSLKEKVAELEAELDRKWIPFRGVLFRTLPSGKIDRAVYCPCCKGSVPSVVKYSEYDPVSGTSFPMGTIAEYFCGKSGCGWRSGVLAPSVDALFRDLASEYGIQVIK